MAVNASGNITGCTAGWVRDPLFFEAECRLPEAFIRCLSTICKVGAVLQAVLWSVATIGLVRTVLRGRCPSGLRSVSRTYDVDLVGCVAWLVGNGLLYLALAQPANWFGDAGIFLVVGLWTWFTFGMSLLFRSRFVHETVLGPVTALDPKHAYLSTDIRTTVFLPEQPVFCPLQLVDRCSKSV